MSYPGIFYGRAAPYITSQQLTLPPSPTPHHATTPAYCVASQALGLFYKDLKDPDYATNFCVYHRRFRCAAPPPLPLLPPLPPPLCVLNFFCIRCIRRCLVNARYLVLGLSNGTRYSLIVDMVLFCTLDGIFSASGLIKDLLAKSALFVIRLVLDNCLLLLSGSFRKRGNERCAAILLHKLYECI